MNTERTTPQQRRCLRLAALLTTWLAVGVPARADVPPLKKRPLTSVPFAKPETASIIKAPKLVPARTETSADGQIDRDSAVGPVSNLSRDGTQSAPATLMPAGERGILRRNHGGRGEALTPASVVRPTAATSGAPPLLHLPPVHSQHRADWDEAIEGDKPLHSLTTNVLPNKGELPANYAAARFAKAGEEWHHVGTSRPWVEMGYDWEATSLCHGPLYFEEDYIERYGHSWGPAQPFVSGAHFFARIPIIPYMATAYPPHECIYTLGHERPGNYVPYHYVRLPLRAGAAAVQAGVVTGLVYLIP